jgi:cytochrome c peroxidase
MPVTARIDGFGDATLRTPSARGLGDDARCAPNAHTDSDRACLYTTTVRIEASRASSWSSRLRRSGGLAVLGFVVAGASTTSACSKTEASQTFRHVEVEEKGIADLSAYIPGEMPPADRVELGRLLFFDPRLSGDGTMSCATCHDPTKGYSDGRATGLGHKGKVLGRNTPTIINLQTRRPFFWDGRAATIEEQAMGPLLSPDEMAAKLEDVIATLSNIPDYVTRFGQAYGDAGITKDTISSAIADFERTIVSSNSPFDRYMAGDKTALSAVQTQGLELFVGKALCVRCHFGPQLADNDFHNIGLAGTDEGRSKIVKTEPAGGFPAVIGGFKTPTLREIARTAPYFHDGSAATLEAVMDHYADKGDKIEMRDGKRLVRIGVSTLPEISLTKEEKAALVEFMKALSGTLNVVTPPELPPASAKSRKR